VFVCLVGVGGGGGGGGVFNKIIIFWNAIGNYRLTQFINSRLTSRKPIEQPFIEASISQAIHLHEVEVKAIEDESVVKLK